MQIILHKRFYVFLLVFAVHFFAGQGAFAKNTHSHKPSWANNQLKTGHYHSEALINENSPIQLVNYRTAKSVRFIKTLLIELMSLVVCLKYLKNQLKSINSKYARFLKLLLYPNHVFW